MIDRSKYSGLSDLMEEEFVLLFNCQDIDSNMFSLFSFNSREISGLNESAKNGFASSGISNIFENDNELDKIILFRLIIFFTCSVEIPRPLSGAKYSFAMTANIARKKIISKHN